MQNLPTPGYKNQYNQIPISPAKYIDRRNTPTSESLVYKHRGYTQAQTSRSRDKNFMATNGLHQGSNNGNSVGMRGSSQNNSCEGDTTLNLTGFSGNWNHEAVSLNLYDQGSKTSGVKEFQNPYFRKPEPHAIRDSEQDLNNDLVRRLEGHGSSNAHNLSRGSNHVNGGQRSCPRGKQPLVQQKIDQALVMQHRIDHAVTNSDQSNRRDRSQGIASGKPSSRNIQATVSKLDAQLESNLRNLENFISQNLSQKDNSLSIFVDGIILPLINSAKGVYDCTKILTIKNELTRARESYRHKLGSEFGFTLKRFLDDSLTVLNEKFTILENCPRKVIDLLENIERIEMQTSNKLEELEIWKKKSNYLLEEIGRENDRRHHDSEDSQSFAVPGNNYKARFYERMMEIKFRLSLGHPAKHILVNDCYSECERMRIGTLEEAIRFIASKFNIQLN